MNDTPCFVVCLHDVAPCAEWEIRRQLALLHPLLGTAVSTAIIPATKGLSWNDAGPEFLEILHPLERLLHGFSHHRPLSLSLISHASGRADELAGLKPWEIEARLSAGQRVMTELFGCPAEGFLPPAWRSGAVGLDHMTHGRITFQVGLRVVTSVRGRHVPLATHAWDWGPVAAMGRIGSLLGRLWGLREGSIPVVALHPCDEERGYLPDALAIIKRLLTRGFAPVTFKQLLEMAG